jgi:hypothetical protein
MSNKPEIGFTIHMTEGTLRVPGQDAHRSSRPGLTIRICGIHSREIEISIEQAKDLTQKAVEHGSDPFRDYRPEVGEKARKWLKD